MRKWPAQVSTVVANVGKELSLLKMAINMANTDYLSFFLSNELEPRCGTVERIVERFHKLCCCGTHCAHGSLRRFSYIDFTSYVAVEHIVPTVHYDVLATSISQVMLLWNTLSPRFTTTF